MGKINAIKKWDLTTNRFREALTIEDKKRALSIATYGTIRHDETDKLNYIIIADGCRVENHTNDVERIDARRGGIENVIRYFERKKENDKIELLMVDNDCPLRIESVFLADYVNSIARQSNVKTVNVLGFSKCGIMVFDMIKLLSSVALAKTRAYSVSSPYTGTIMASPLFLERKVTDVIHAKIPIRALADKIINAVMSVYNKTLSNSHMDFDIAEAGGVPDSLASKYDPSFLGNIFREENVNSVNNVKHYENICTLIDNSVLKRALKTGNLNDIGLCILNDVLFDGKADGIVLYSSQAKIESEVPDLGVSKVIHSTHCVLKNPKCANELLDVVNDNMVPEEKQKSI